MSIDKTPKGLELFRKRREKFGDSSLSRPELLKLRLDSLLAEEGVIVRRALVSQMGRIVSRIEQGNMDHVDKFVVIGADIRKLKEVNEPTLGGNHVVGDKVIFNAGAGLAREFRVGAGDIVSRVGGDEFLAILLIHPGREDFDTTNLDESIQNRIGDIRSRVENGLAILKEEHEFLKENGRGTIDVAAQILTKEELVNLWHQKRNQGDFATSLQEQVSQGIYSQKKSGGNWASSVLD